MVGRTKLLAWLTAVAASMTVLFLLPATFFVPGTFAVTTFMILAARAAGGYSGLREPSGRAIWYGLASAGLLYAVFYGGNLAIGALRIPELSPSAENSIYSLIASPANPLTVKLAVMAFDAVGYESLFRGVLQRRLQVSVGVFAAPGVAALDAGLHIATLNPLWVATTFVADLAWGLTYYYGKDLSASVTSHFVWDVAIFVIRPIV